MSHSIIPPSSAGIWGKPDGCTGWVLMAQTYPDTEESQEARDGTASHEIAARMIEYAARGNVGDVSREAIGGQAAENGVIFTDEMFDAARLYADDVEFLMKERGVFGGPSLGVEKRLEMPQIHDMSFGTVDCFLYDAKRKELFVWDYKFGYEVVEAFQNWQAVNYVAGIVRALGLEPKHHITVRIRIAQPRAFHRDGPIREWVTDSARLHALWDTLRTNADKALAGHATFKTGRHCKHCPGRHACPAALKAGLSLYEVAAQPVPVELGAEALAVQYGIVQRARKQLEYLESGFEEQIKGLIRSGANVQGYRVEEGVGRERWAKPVEEVIALGDMLGHDLRKGDAVTPNAARKLGIDDAVIMAYSEKPKTGLKIVPDNGNKAKQIFSK